jgi:uncharacterized protein
MGARAREMGIREEDVPRLVDEVRRENSERGKCFGVTADTNILVSGLLYKRGKPYDLLTMALAGEINLITSEHILDEMSDVMARKFAAIPQEIDEARLIVRDAARVVTPAVQLDVIKEDPPDNRILECAVTAGSDYIVTGDKDLLGLGQYDAIQILTVSDFLKLARGEGPGL